MTLESTGSEAQARTYRATVQYDGTAYNGFQRQRRGVPSIQAELEQALARLLNHPTRVLGAGRTDTGVHALGQVISFTIEWPDRHGPEALHRALNANLPPDIVIAELAEAAVCLIGEHDFATFGRPTVGESTVREIFDAHWQRRGDLLVFRICANAFLNRMVRSIVGSLKAVGSGKWTSEILADAMAACERKRSATAAPAHGLYLISVEYND